MGSATLGAAMPAERVRTRALVLVMRYSLELTQLVEQLAGLGTSGNHELQVLTTLYRSGSCSRKELVASTGMSRSGVAQVIDRLAGIGLIESSPAPRDHRVVLASLTTAGRNRVISLEKGFGDHFGTPNPLVEALLDLITTSTPITRQRPASPLDTIARLSGLGARLSERIGSEVGITETRERLAVAALAENGDTRAGELADVLGLTSGGTTYLVDQLVADGLAERLYGAVPTDRRAVLIRLTTSGWAASERFADIVLEHADQIVEELTRAHADP